MNLVLLLPEDRVSGARGSHATIAQRGEVRAADLDGAHAEGVSGCAGSSGDGVYRLAGRRCKHVQEIHRAKVGDELTVGLLGDLVGRGVVVALDEERLDLDVTLQHEPPSASRVTLLLALPRPPVLRRVLIAATSMGIKRIVLMNANAVEKSFWQSRALEPQAITDQLVLGLEQARDTRMPEVLLRPRFRPFVEDELGAWAGLRLVAHPGPEARASRGVGQDVLLAVGPESGWTAYELEKLQASGFGPTSLGPRSLRVETAVPALLAQLS
jgi:RsmE family RNA methyltransferase